MQHRMTEMLRVIDGICHRHGLRYWLCSGTLLGAVRHEGYIPWDDDLDIEMMRPDYDRLMEILPRELPEDMALQTPDTDAGYFFCYAKVRDRRSRLSETNDYDRISSTAASSSTFSLTRKCRFPSCGCPIAPSDAYIR